METVADSPQSLSSDTVFEVLSNRRRRYAVHYLLQRDDVVEFRRLTEQITAWENDIPVTAVNHDQRKRVYTALRQTHLPRMADAGIIEYNRQRGLVQPTDAIREFEIYLDIVAKKNIPWSKFYLGLGTLATGLSLLLVLGVQPFSLVPGDFWSLGIGLAFVITGAIHTHANQSRRLGTGGPPSELRYE